VDVIGDVALGGFEDMRCRHSCIDRRRVEN
jgi:hypothetical protein